jgi:Na+/H+ antiporter NhaB
VVLVVATDPRDVRGHHVTTLINQDARDRLAIMLTNRDVHDHHVTTLTSQMKAKTLVGKIATVVLLVGLVLKTAVAGTIKTTLLTHQKSMTNVTSHHSVRSIQ